MKRTAKEIILLAAVNLTEHETTPFSRAQLIVQSWRTYPEIMGLNGHSAEHPDSNKIDSQLMGQRGLVSQGLLQKTEAGYALTEAGRSHCRHLQNPSNTNSAPAPKAKPLPCLLDAEQQDDLLRLLNSTAVSMYTQKRVNDLTFPVACKFWGMSANVTGTLVDATLDGFDMHVGEMGQALERGGGESVLPNGQVVSTKDTDGISTIHYYMLKMFHKQLQVLRSRKP